MKGINKISPFILIAIPLCLCISCEKGFTISGQITGIADSTLINLQNISTGEYLDSSWVMNGHFTFEGQLTDVPEELRIISGLKELEKGILFYTDLLMGNEEVQVHGDISDLPLNVTTTGSATQDEAENYRKQLHAWHINLDNLKNHFQSFPDSVNTIQKKEAEQRLKEAKDALEHWKVNFIKEHFNSYIGLLMYNYRRDFNIDTLKKLFHNVSEELKQSKYGKAIATQINYPKPQMGDEYYDFEAINAKGIPSKLSATGDQYILLQFAGTGCYWSGLSNQEMKKIHEKYKDAVSFVSYFIDNKKAMWLSTTEKDSITWLSLWNEGGKYSEVYNKYGLTGTPTFFLLSPDKKVISTWFGYEEGMIEDEIGKALEQQEE